METEFIKKNFSGDEFCSDGSLFDAQPNVNCSIVVFVMPPQIAFYINIDIYFTLINVYCSYKQA